MEYLEKVCFLNEKTNKNYEIRIVTLINGQIECRVFESGSTELAINPLVLDDITFEAFSKNDNQNLIEHFDKEIDKHN